MRAEAVWRLLAPMGGGDWDGDHEEAIEEVLQRLENEFGGVNEEEEEEDEASDESPVVFDLAGSDSADNAGEPDEEAAPAPSAPDSMSSVQVVGVQAVPRPAPTRTGGEDSDGFEEVPARPSRKRQRVEAAAAAAAAALKPQPTECTICYDPCSMTGRHRLVALKCGHLFGKKCIDRWVAERKTCPNCNMVVRRSDVRVLFSDHVAVVDNSGVEAMRLKWEDEKSKRIQAETDLSRVKLQLQMAKADAQRSQTEAAEWKRQVEALQAEAMRGAPAILPASLPMRAQNAAGFGDRYGSGSDTTRPRVSDRFGMESNAESPPRQFKPIAPFDPASQPNPGPILVETQLSSQLAQSQPSRMAREASFPSRPLGEPRGVTWVQTQQTESQFTEVFRAPLVNSRVFALASSGSMLCVGECASPMSHGILKVSMTSPRHSVRIMAHQQPVRDVAISAHEDLALTVAFDGKLVVTHLDSHTAVLHIPLPPARRHGWSCAFSPSDPNAMYCGFHDGVVAKYDLRQTAGGERGTVATFALHEKQPVHSIKLFAHSSRSDLGDGLAAATFSGVSMWDQVSGTGGNEAIPFAHHVNVAGCCSLGVTASSGCKAVVSSRTMGSSPALHEILSLEPSLTRTGQCLRGHRTPSVLTRSTIWADAASGDLRVASGDDASGCAVVWDVASGRVVQPLAPPLPGAAADASQTIVDVQHSPAERGGHELLGVLRQREIALFSTRPR